MATKYSISVVIDSVPDGDELPEEIGVDGPTLGVYEADSLIEAAMVARFLGAIALRLPPVDSDKLIDNEIREGLL